MIYELIWQVVHDERAGYLVTSKITLLFVNPWDVLFDLDFPNNGAPIRNGLDCIVVHVPIDAEVLYMYPEPSGAA